MAVLALRLATFRVRLSCESSYPASVLDQSQTPPPLSISRTAKQLFAQIARALLRSVSRGGKGRVANTKSEVTLRITESGIPDVQCIWACRVSRLLVSDSRPSGPDHIDFSAWTGRIRQTKIWPFISLKLASSAPLSILGTSRTVGLGVARLSH